MAGKHNLPFLEMKRMLSVLICGTESILFKFLSPEKNIFFFPLRNIIIALFIYGIGGRTICRHIHYGTGMIRITKCECQRRFPVGWNVADGSKNFWKFNIFKYTAAHLFFPGAQLKCACSNANVDACCAWIHAICTDNDECGWLFALSGLPDFWGVVRLQNGRMAGYGPPCPYHLQLHTVKPGSFGQKEQCVHLL